MELSHWPPSTLMALDPKEYVPSPQKSWPQLP